MFSLVHSEFWTPCEFYRKWPKLGTGFPPLLLWSALTSQIMLYWYVIKSYMLNCLAYTKVMQYNIAVLLSFIFNNHFIVMRVVVDPKPILGILCALQEYVLEGMLVHHKTPHTEVHLRSPRSDYEKAFHHCSLLDRRKLDNPEKAIQIHGDLHRYDTCVLLRLSLP